MIRQTEEVYVFFIKRPHDKEPWPVVYSDYKLAVNASHRVSGIEIVNFPLPMHPS